MGIPSRIDGENTRGRQNKRTRDRERSTVIRMKKMEPSRRNGGRTETIEHGRKRERKRTRRAGRETQRGQAWREKEESDITRKTKRGS